MPKQPGCFLSRLREAVRDVIFVEVLRLQEQRSGMPG